MMMPAGYHDLAPLHELSFQSPAGTSLFGDKGANCAADEASILKETGLRVVPVRKANMVPNELVDAYDLRQMRHSVETVNSQLEKMGMQHLHARTNNGFEIKVR